MIVQGESERLAIVLGAGKGCARNCNFYEHLPCSCICVREELRLASTLAVAALLGATRKLRASLWPH
jgi:hypothetical protein